MAMEQETFTIEHSIERDNINKRLQLSNDSTQIMWIYCLSQMGNIVLSSPVIGKVTSSSKRLEPARGDPLGSSYHGDVVEVGRKKYIVDELMAADGVYGQSDQYVFWFTPEGQYFQWNGPYIVSNAPLKLDRPVLNVKDIDYAELQRAKIAEKALKVGKKINNNLEEKIQK